MLPSLRPLMTVLSAATLLIVPIQPLSAQLPPGSTPSIDWKTIDNQPVTNDTLQGYLVIIDFWATWCGPCVAQIPHMLQLHAKYADQGVQIVGVSLDVSLTPMRKMIQDRGMNWLHVFDQGKNISRAWGVYAIPTVFILSPEGRVLWTGHPAELDQPLAKALQEHPPYSPQVRQALARIHSAAQQLTSDNLEAALTPLEQIPDDLASQPPVQQAFDKLAKKIASLPQDQQTKIDQVLTNLPNTARRLGRNQSSAQS